MLGVLVLATGRTAHAAMAVGLSTQPAEPTVGEATLVQVRTYAPVVVQGSSDWRLEPAVVPTDYPFRVETVDPAGSVSSLPISRTSDPYVWAGQFAFTKPGTWEIRITNFGPNYDPRAGARLEVHVSGEAGPPVTSLGKTGPPVASVLLATLGAAVALSIVLLVAWKRALERTWRR